MSRSMVISITILMICLSMKMVNYEEASNFDEKNITLVGFIGEPMIDETDVSLANPDTFKSNVVDLTTPSEIIGASVGDALWTTTSFIIKGVKFIVELMYASAFFGTFIQTLGRDCAGVAGCIQLKIIPDYAATVLNAGAIMCHLYFIWQVLSGRSDYDSA